MKFNDSLPLLPHHMCGWYLLIVSLNQKQWWAHYRHSLNKYLLKGRVHQKSKFSLSLNLFSFPFVGSPQEGLSDDQGSCRQLFYSSLPHFPQRINCCFWLQEAGWENTKLPMIVICIQAQFNHSCNIHTIC